MFIPTFSIIENLNSMITKTLNPRTTVDYLILYTKFLLENNSSLTWVRGGALNS
jgi:hypothetical protein